MAVHHGYVFATYTCVATAFFWKDPIQGYIRGVGNGGWVEKGSKAWKTEENDLRGAS